MTTLQSLIADRWVGTHAGASLASAIDGAEIYHAHADELDFGEALDFARRTGGAALLALDFQQRAARLNRAGVSGLLLRQRLRAYGVQDGDPAQLQPGEREAHGDAVVGIGLDRRGQPLAGQRWIADHHQLVALLVGEARTDAIELGGEGGQPVAFLDA